MVIFASCWPADLQVAACKTIWLALYRNSCR